MGDKFNQGLGQLLKETRIKLGLTLEEVSSGMGFNNYQTLSAIEDGSRKIKAYELAALAKIYMRDISYFLVSQEKIENELVIWRDCLDDQTSKLKEQEFLKYCYNYFELEQKLALDYKCKLPKQELNLDDLDFNRIAELAKEYHRILQLGARPACCLEKILEETYNIKILYLDLAHYGSAASAVGKFGSAILINASEPFWRRNYDLAHELFHIITWNVFKHEDIHLNKNGSKPVVEKWADSFASNLLLPQDEVVREFEKRLEDDKIRVADVIEMARYFLVSTEALAWRLVSLRLVNAGVVEETLKLNEFRELDKAKRVEDGRDAPDISFRYVSLAFRAYKKGVISRGKLAEYLNVNRADLGGKLDKYGLKEEVSYDGKLATA